MNEMSSIFSRFRRARRNHYEAKILPSFLLSEVFCLRECNFNSYGEMNIFVLQWGRATREERNDFARAFAAGLVKISRASLFTRSRILRQCHLRANCALAALLFPPRCSGYRSKQSVTWFVADEKKLRSLISAPPLSQYICLDGSMRACHVVTFTACLRNRYNCAMSSAGCKKYAARKNGVLRLLLSGSRIYFWNSLSLHQFLI